MSEPRSVAEVGALIGDPGVHQPERVTGWQADGALTGQYVWANLPAEARVVATRAVALVPELVDMLSGVGVWTARADEIGGQYRDMLAAAKTKVDQVRGRLVTDPAAAVELVAATRAVAELEAARPAFNQARTAANYRAYSEYSSKVDAIFQVMQAKAYEVVQRVAGVLPLPEQVWGAADPERTMVNAGRISDWGVLVECEVRWRLLHEVANLLREQIGADPDRLPGAAPRLALVYRNWEAAFADNEQGKLRQLRAPLRLAYAVRHKWQPGIWRPSDVAVADRDPSFGERLMARAGEVLVRARKPAGVTPKVPPAPIPEAKPPVDVASKLGFY